MSDNRRISFADQWDELERERIDALFDRDEKRVAEIRAKQREISDELSARMDSAVRPLLAPEAK